MTAMGMLAALAILGGWYGYLAIFDAAPARKPVTIDTFKEALTAYARGQSERACELLGYYCDRYPADAEARVLLGKFLVELGRLKEASKVLAALEGAESVEVNRAILLAAIARQTGEYHQAQTILRGVIKKHPNDARLWRETGQFLAQIGDTRNAAAAIQKSLALDPKQEDLRSMGSDLASRAATSDLQPPNPASARGPRPSGPRPGGIDPFAPPNPHTLVPNPAARPDPMTPWR